MTLAEVTKERDAAMRDLAGLQADARNFEARMKELMEAKEALTAQFHEVGAKLLSEAQKQFLERADARFNQAEREERGAIEGAAPAGRGDAEALRGRASARSRRRGWAATRRCARR